jgi:hypothetical protein
MCQPIVGNNAAGMLNPLGRLAEIRHGLADISDFCVLGGKSVFVSNGGFLESRCSVDQPA